RPSARGAGRHQPLRDGGHRRGVGLPADRGALGGGAGPRDGCGRLPDAPRLPPPGQRDDLPGDPARRGPDHPPHHDLRAAHDRGASGVRGGARAGVRGPRDLQPRGHGGVRRDPARPLVALGGAGPLLVARGLGVADRAVRRGPRERLTVSRVAQAADAGDALVAEINAMLADRLAALDAAEYRTRVMLSTGLPSVRYGLELIDASKAAFGMRGRIVPLAGLLVTCAGWSYVMAAMTAEALANMT